MRKIIPSTLASTGMDMVFAQISIFPDDISDTYLVPFDDAASEVLEAAFGDTAVFAGTSYRLELGISRKQVLLPRFEIPRIEIRQDFTGHSLNRSCENK